MHNLDRIFNMTEVPCENTAEIRKALFVSCKHWRAPLKNQMAFSPFLSDVQFKQHADLEAEVEHPALTWLRTGPVPNVRLLLPSPPKKQPNKQKQQVNKQWHQVVTSHATTQRKISGTNRSSEAWRSHNQLSWTHTRRPQPCSQPKPSGDLSRRARRKVTAARCEGQCSSSSSPSSSVPPH